ncbi:hypothetical protein ACSBR2_016114 [Camellia fascicularis]
MRSAWQEGLQLTGSTYLELGLPECNQAWSFWGSASGSLRYAAQRGHKKPRWFRRSARFRQDSLIAWLGGDCWVCADRWDSSTTCRETNGSTFGAQKVYKHVCAPHAGDDHFLVGGTKH